MKIGYLADHPQYITMTAKWIFDEWGHQSPNTTLESIEDRFCGHLNRKEIPFTVLAMEGEEPIGTASLVFHDLKDRQDLSPWLSGVYVLPNQRGKGIGTKLVKVIELLAAQLGEDQLYLFTPDRESFYTRLGWTVLERTQLRNKDFVIMEKEIG